MAIVYTHIKKNDNTVFYVGIGSSEKRAYIKSNRNVLWRKIVSKYDYIVQITHKDLLWEEACSIEKYLISFYGRICTKDGTLSNFTEGGEGILGFKKSDEMKENNRLTMLGKKNGLGSKHSKEAVDKRKEKMKDYVMSEETKNKIGIAHKGRKLPDWHKKKVSESLRGINATWYGKYGEFHNTSKWVYQYTMDGIFVEKYGSMREALRKTSIYHISCCCNGNRKSAGGYIWKY